MPWHGAAREAQVEAVHVKEKRQVLEVFVCQMVDRKVLRRVRHRYLELLSNKGNISNNSIIAIIAITPIIAIRRTVCSALNEWQ